MAGDFGANALKGTFMKLSDLGEIVISVIPKADDPEIMTVDIVAERRIEPMSMTTNKDETTDQFCQRVRSMMRALHNGLTRNPEVPQPAQATQTFEQQKAERKKKAHEPNPMPAPQQS